MSGDSEAGKERRVKADPLCGTTEPQQLNFLSWDSTPF